MFMRQLGVGASVLKWWDWTAVAAIAENNKDQ